jgi:hypothetical protein
VTDRPAALSVVIPNVSGDAPRKEDSMDAPSRSGLGPDDPCPPWCRRDHVATAHPDDRHHQSDAALVALVTGNPVLEPDEAAHPVSAVVRLVRRVGSDVTWLEVVSEEGSEVRLVVTTESARRLVATLQRTLAQA